MTNSDHPRTLAIAGATGTLGRHVAAQAASRGHHVVPLSRAHGVDLMTGDGVAEALEGVDAVIDVVGVATLSARVARAFFSTTTGVLREAERAAGVPHHVAVSIVGIDGADDGYYAGKLAQEAALAASGPDWSLLRAAQFHEFVGQTLAQASLGPLATIPAARIRPIAAAEVATALIDAALADPAGRLPDLVGPREERLASLARELLAARRVRRAVLEVPFPGAMGRAMRSGALCGGAEARRGAQPFADWLAAGEESPTLER